MMPTTQGTIAQSPPAEPGLGNSPACVVMGESKGNVEFLSSCLFPRRVFSGEGGCFGSGMCMEGSRPHARKNMAQKLHNKASSDEDELFNKV